MLTKWAVVIVAFAAVLITSAIAWAVHEIHLVVGDNTE